MNAGIIAAVLALAGVAIGGAIYARRAWLLAVALERQIKDTRAQQADQHREDIEQARIATGRLEAQIGRAREEMVAGLDSAYRNLNSRLDNLERDFNQRMVKLSEVHSKATVDMAGKISTIADAVEFVTRKRLHPYPIDSGRLETEKEEHVIELAQSLAVLRPLVPYPKWRFDADWANPDLAFLLRQRLWQYFSDRRREVGVVARWHYGTRLRLYLGNDLSRQIYVAGCIDPNEFAFLDRVLQRGMTVLDVGANEGVYTVFAAKRLGGEGTVWAFEPSPREVGRLQRNLELNNLSARVFSLALAEQAGHAEMAIAGYGHEDRNRKFAVAAGRD
jgi:hypothetical protein